jgi:uroporphyrinogen decarboxylase
MDSRLSASPYLRACRGEATEHTPVWLNRQAGRYMPEYHALKGKTPSLEFFKNPELAAQATLDAQRILGVDAAIMFADLLPMLEPMGLELAYIEGVGPRFANPLRSPRTSPGSGPWWRKRARPISPIRSASVGQAYPRISP